MLRAGSIIILIIGSIACSPKRSESVSSWEEPITGIEFVRIPKGSFIMGSQSVSDSLNIEVPHKVNISKDFWLARTEVTQQQWQLIMGAEEIHPEKPSPYRNTNPQYPVVSISYFDIQKFLENLNALSPDHTFRLPTEAEWEYACRAGTTTSFSTGSQISDTEANFNAEIASEYSAPGNYTGHPVAVASYSPNAWGLYDMHGNVWEWVADWYAPYSSEPAMDPQGPFLGKQKVIRGGSWYYGAKNARSSARRTHEPDLWGFSIGFRIVCEHVKGN